MHRSTERLPVFSIAPMPPTVASSILRGHVLGSVPDASVLTSHISGGPDTGAAVPRPTAKHLATGRALTGDLILHSRTLRGMRDSKHQHNKFLAAHVLGTARGRRGLPRATSPTSEPAHRSPMSPCTDSTAGAGG
jgi:hypothetical protein